MQKSVSQLRKEIKKTKILISRLSPPPSTKCVYTLHALLGHGPETVRDGIVKGNGLDANVAAVDQVMAHQATAACFPLPVLRAVIIG